MKFYRKQLVSAWFFIFIFLTVVSGCSRIQMKEWQQPVQEQTVKIQNANFKIREGEKLKFSVRWFGMEVGTADVVVKGIEEIHGRKAYHIAVSGRSNSVVDLIYPVRDEHHTYIDVEHFHSLRYEKVLKEGRYRADAVMDFDQEAHEAVYLSRRRGSKKQILIPKNVQDELSTAFWLRVQPMKLGETITIPVNVDGTNWQLAIKVSKREQVRIGKLGIFDAIHLDPEVKFQGVFIHRGKITGWMSVDDKRLPLLMKTRIPVLGSIDVILVSYEGW